MAWAASMSDLDVRGLSELRSGDEHVVLVQVVVLDRSERRRDSRHSPCCRAQCGKRPQHALGQLGSDVPEVGGREVAHSFDVALDVVGGRGRRKGRQARGKQIVASVSDLTLKVGELSDDSAPGFLVGAVEGGEGMSVVGSEQPASRPFHRQRLDHVIRRQPRQFVDDRGLSQLVQMVRMSVNTPAR